MKNADSLADLSATELLPLYRKKELSPVDVTKAVLTRIDGFQGRFLPFCHLDPQAALADAELSEARWLRGRPLGLVDGIPTTVKDLILTKGWPTLRGSRTVDAAQAWTEDAPAVARLREHGAVIVGKTTTPEFGWKGVCDSPLGGATRNPWDPRMTPGGSSGGAAVAAALGMGCLHIGTDGGGSIRIPASFTGIFGLKPTFGLVPAFPLSPFGRVAHLGPMTRSVADAARMLTVMAEPDIRDWHSLPHIKRDFSIGLDSGIAGVRIALSLTLGYVEVDPQVRALVKAVAGVLADLGAIVEECDPGFADPTAIFEAHWFSGAANLRRSIPKSKWPLMDPGLTRFADAGERIGHMDYLEAVDRCGALGTHMGLFHERFDILLTPSVPIAAFEVNRVAPSGSADPGNWVPWTPFSYPFNLTQQPAASIPCGLTATGLPVGVQIVGAKYRDDLVLRVARAYESAVPLVAPPVLRGE
jgi:aspartyl-tRNA(Asn)/glutamyl-tRNA(Gln) amidotransferase subunit A